jgi:light-regulated signal transduction histidine kinase (bacteriophytochrome)
MDLVDAGGVAVVENGEPVTCGGAPPADVIREIARWLEERGDLRPFSSASLGVHFPPALAASEVASGLLTFALPGARLMWFRPEVIQTVNWGGDPTKPVDAEAGKRLRPRHSFALWKEEVRARSRPWTPSDLEAPTSCSAAPLMDRDGVFQRAARRARAIRCSRPSPGNPFRVSQAVTSWALAGERPAPTTG